MLPTIILQAIDDGLARQWIEEASRQHSVAEAVVAATICCSQHILSEDSTMCMPCACHEECTAFYVPWYMVYDDRMSVQIARGVSAPAGQHPWVTAEQERHTAEVLLLVQYMPQVCLETAAVCRDVCRQQILWCQRLVWAPRMACISCTLLPGRQPVAGWQQHLSSYYARYTCELSVMWPQRRCLARPMGYLGMALGPAIANNCSAGQVDQHMQYILHSESVSPVGSIERLKGGLSTKVYKDMSKECIAAQQHK